MAKRQRTQGSELPSLLELAGEISSGANRRPIGKLQEKRARWKKLKRISNLFDKRSVKERWAFHVGGLAELQFNIGFEKIHDRDVFRHGIAFSLTPTRYTADISVFKPRIRKFNRYLDNNPKAYADLSMWYFVDHQRSRTFAPVPIPESLISQRPFVMLGSICPVDAVDVATVLDDFDRLMPIYEYVEGDTDSSGRQTLTAKKFRWSPGNNPRVVRANFERPEQDIGAVLRHNKLQAALFTYLESVHGEKNVSGEQDCGNGTHIDIAVKNGSRCIYYEIKTGLSARSCIREAFGQLMEYAFWPGAREAQELTIVGEPCLDKDARKYLERLRKKSRSSNFHSRTSSSI